MTRTLARRFASSSPSVTPLVGLIGLVGLAACSKTTAPASWEASAEPAASTIATTTSGAAAAPSARATKARNVVLITIDSMRADMPWAGYTRPIAPRLTELSRRAVVYSRAYAASSFTSKSVPTMLSGRLPSELERTGKFFTRYLAKNDFMCESFAPGERSCVAGHAHNYLGPGESGLEQGFADWRLVPGITFDYQKDPWVTSHKLTPLAQEQLTKASASGRPFFAWFHYMDPHDDYFTHEDSPHFGKSARDRYDEEIFYTDKWVGALVDFIQGQPWGKETVLVFSADHGECFGEHGMFRHAHELWEELVHVPLFVVGDGFAPRTIDTPRSHIDLVPTFRELLGAAPDATLRGKSLASELAGAAAEPRDVVVDLPEDQYNERRRALVSGTTKLIAFGRDARFALFDLAADPKESKDLGKERPELLESMKARYRAASASLREVAVTGAIPGRKP